MFQNGQTAISIDSFTSIHSGAYMGSGFTRGLSRSKELTPLYSEVLEIVKSKKRGTATFSTVATLVTLTAHHSRVRLALSALVEMGFLVDTAGIYFEKEKMVS